MPTFDYCVTLQSRCLAFVISKLAPRTGVTHQKLPVFCTKDNSQTMSESL